MSAGTTQARGCHGGGYGYGGYGSVGAILVLFILLVIITRAFWV